MRIHYIKYITLSASLLAFTGCSNETDIANSNDGKQPIELSVGQDAPSTRAVITDGDGKTLTAFESATDIWMVMQSDYKALSGDNANPSDIDYKGSQSTTNCVTMGTTGDKTGTDLKENVVNFLPANTRYWDDAHARSSALSIWAIAVPNKQSTALWSTSGWGSSAATTKDWTISSIQTSATIANEDLCFSNNIADNTSASKPDGRMKFNNTSNPKGFESGKLIFYHALTKITIKMVPGDGFKKDGTDFKFDDGSTPVAYTAASVPVALKGFNRSGTFNVKQGEFTSTSTANIEKVSNKSYENTAGYILEALVMPGTDLNGSLTNAISFSIDGNAFNVSAATLKSKLPNDFEKFEAGNNYVFTFTINKTDIDVTATIAKWDNVEAAEETPLINVAEPYGHDGTTFGKNFSFLRSLSQTSGYADKADVTYASNTYTMTPQLYWPNHYTHMFFRGVWPEIGESTGTLQAKVDDSKIAVENVAYAPDTYPSDLMIGFPRKKDSDGNVIGADETCKVPSHNNASGICATEGEIRMNFQYVMSKVKVELKTSEEGSANRVNFNSNTKVEIVGGYTGGNILLSNGSANLTTKADYTMHRNGDTDVEYFDAIIPQSLGTGDAKLKFRITVTDTDGHQDKYETVFGIADIDMGGGSTISAWEAGKFYTYTLTITKTGIKVTATIKDWVTATGSTTIWM